MSKITVIDKAIDINEKHINEYQLEANSGTKKMKATFYKNAVIQRNKYVTSQQEQFNLYKKHVYLEMKTRVAKYFPVDNGEIYNNERTYLDEFKKVIKFNNGTLDSSYKLGFLKLISKIKEDNSASLDEINDILKEFISKFKDMSLELTVNDFSYSMFTLEYMKVFFESYTKEVDLKTTFESVYWECPDFIKHLKLNLWTILDKYKKVIDGYSETVRVQLLNSYTLEDKTPTSYYYERLRKYEDNYSIDSYENLNRFLEGKKNIADYLEGTSIRNGNFNLLALNNDFTSLSEESKNKYYTEILDFSKTLAILKKYYRYEFIVKDLQEKFSKRVENKSLYDNKLKEITKEETNRKKILASYMRANGVGFLAKKDDKKISSCKLSMNESISKLYILYNELHDLEIINKMNKQLTEVSSLYDLFMTGYSSYYYLEKVFTDNFKDIENFSIDDEFLLYFDFIYRPNNSFLTKINAFVPCDVSEVISDKYRLLELNVSKEMVMKDSIDSTIDTVNYIKLVKNINDGSLPIEVMNFIVSFKKLDEVDLSNLEEMEFL